MNDVARTVAHGVSADTKRNGPAAHTRNTPTPNADDDLPLSGGLPSVVPPPPSRRTDRRRATCVLNLSVAASSTATHRFGFGGQLARARSL